MQVNTFCDKLNKVDGNIYVVEEEIHFTNGVYEAELQHDNINEATFAVFTGPKLTGTRLETYTLSTPSLAPWKRIVRVYADVPVAYISYETDGDTVEGDDINRVQAAVVETQKALNTEGARALSAEMELNGRMSPPSWWSGLKFRGSLIAVHIIASPLSRRIKLKIRQLQNYIQLPTPLPFSQTPQSLLNCKKRLGKTNSVQQKRWGKPHPFHNLVRMYKECILPLSLPCPNLFKPRHQHLSAGFQNDPSLFSCGA